MAREGRVSSGEEEPLFPPPCLTADCNTPTYDPLQVTSTLIQTLLMGFVSLVAQMEQSWKGAQF